ncbi:MAG: glycosyl transferase, partial [Chloroflexota bacterium]
MATMQASVSTTRTSSVVRPILIGLVVLVSLFLLLYHLSDFPRPWYDEGSHLHVAKNFALNGVYADSSSEGYRPFGPAIGVGPTVMLPVAALFRAFGVSIPLARLVIVVYSILTLLTLYVMMMRFVSWPYGLLAVILLLTVPAIGYLYYSRTVVGEIPGTFFFLLGLALWLHPRGRTIAGLVGVGVLIGLSTIT